jgi:flagellar basal-body rod protein FlgB
VEEALQAQNKNSRRLQMERTNARHLPLRSYTDRDLISASKRTAHLSLRADGNTVDIDETMGKMAENTIKFKTAAQLISRKFRGLKNAIQGGK